MKRLMLWKLFIIGNMIGKINMSTLNPQQTQAITYLDGPLLVIAGAGSGKTRVITHKIAYLIETCQVAPKHIYALTFTNKAAKEMTYRAQRLMCKNKKVNINKKNI